MDFINFDVDRRVLIAILRITGFTGLTVSATNTVGMAISWCVGFFSLLMSQAIAMGTFYRFILNFTNGVDQLQASGNLAVATLSTEQLSRSFRPANLPMPFDHLSCNGKYDERRI